MSKTITININIPSFKSIKPQARTLTRAEWTEKARKAKGTVATKLRSMAAALED